jgi:transcriptional regulator with XRE-family HTH domain
MPFKKTNRLRGEILRNLRESQSVEITGLARQVNLSVAQLRQLESDELAPGERSLFYSESIKDAAARKVALALGWSPDELVLDLATEKKQPDDLLDMQVLDDLQELMEKQKKAQAAGQRSRFFQSKALWFAMALCMLAALVWHFRKPLFEQVQPFVLSKEPLAPVAVVAAAPASEALAVDDAFVVPEAPSAQPAELLCAQKVSGAFLKPSMPSKAGNMVHIVAQADTAVCVQDASGKKFPISLKAQESHSFYGAAPWTVHLGHAAQVQVFFQGQRIRWPEGEPTSITLQEIPGAY